MISTLKAYASLIKVAVFGALALGVLVFYEGIPFLVSGRVDIAYQRGVDTEALEWTKRMAALRAEGERRRIEDQAKIDAAEAEYLAEKTAKIKAQDELAKASRASPTRGKEVLSRELTRELNKVGKKP
jgi:hypothetical protein